MVDVHRVQAPFLIHKMNQSEHSHKRVFDKMIYQEGMIMKKLQVMKKTGCVVLATTMLVAMTGCGSSGDAAQTSESGAKKIVVATGNSFAPYCYLNENNEVVGYEVDVLNAMDERIEEFEFDIQGMSFNTAVVSIDSGSADMVSYQLVPSDERKEKYIFPETSYAYSPLALCVKTDSGIAGLEDMGGKKIYGTPTTYEYVLLNAYNEAHPESEYEIVAVTDMETADMYRGVSNGTVDASLWKVWLLLRSSKRVMLRK